MDKGTLTLKGEERTLRKTEIKNVCAVWWWQCYFGFLQLWQDVNQEAQFLIDGFQEAKAEVDAEEAQKADSEGQEQQTETDKKEQHSEKEQVREPETEATEFLNRRNQKRVRFMWIFVEQWWIRVCFSLKREAGFSRQ